MAIIDELLKKLEEGTATQKDLQKYAALLGEGSGSAIAKAFLNDSVSGDDLQILAIQMLKSDFEKISDYGDAVQKASYEAENIHLKPVRPKFNDRSAVDAIREIAEKENPTERYITSRIAVEDQRVADRHMQANAEAANNAGLEVKVSREYISGGFGEHTNTSHPQICMYCKSRDTSGEMIPYLEAYNRGVFQRHPNCRCIIEYTNAKGVTTYQTQKGGRDTWLSEEEFQRRKNYNETTNKHNAAINEQVSLIRKYGNLEKMMLTGSTEDLSRWQALISITGKSEKDILLEMSKNADNWETLLKAQTEKQMEKLTNQLLDTATDTELGALNIWSGETYANINRYKRYGVHVDAISRNAANNIESILSRMRTPEDMIVRRGTGTKHIFEKMPLGWEEDPTLLIGHSFTDKGFTATSPFEKGGFGGSGKGNAELFIHVPKGVHGAYIANEAHNDLEKEFLLQRGYEYRIVKAEYRPNKYNPDEKDLKVWAEVIWNE